MTEQENTGVLCAMSGGVDSTVAAYLLQQTGYRCSGVTMRLYCENADAQTCGSAREAEAAAKAAADLGIPFSVLDCSDAFSETIIKKFIRTYESGGTPNPCIDCNRCMKFGKLLEFAQESGLACIATGHYARIEKDAATGRYLLKKALDPSKDQSYVLHLLTQQQLAHTLFPLGTYTKKQVRAIAEENGFSSAKKPDSQDICFVPDGDYAAFMERYTGKTYPPGAFENADGAVVGTHRGAVRYTIGQRKGLGLAMPEPVYVYEKDMEANVVRVGAERLLFHHGLVAKDFNWIAYDVPPFELRAKAKARYRHVEQWATVTPQEDGTVRVLYDEPQRAITVGQSVVLYQDDIVLGGGTIAEVFD